MLKLRIYKRNRRQRTPVPPDPPKENRKFARTDSVKKVTYKVLIPAEGEGFTQNVSDSGFGLFLEDEVPPGSVMEFQYVDMSHNSESEKPIAKVIWQKDHEAGIKVLGH
ncbi:MAG: hypothetical protein GQ544_05245 [Candidatus Aminicenantes bacterium]|nr:hypothetical protein [Candidatus Aminicenantes bacterium]